MASRAETDILLPGDAANKTALGSFGTHVFGSETKASLAGTISPSNAFVRSTSISSSAPILPYVGSIVLTRVLRCTPRQAIVAILTVDNVPCTTATASNATSGSEHWQGLIRVQDVRATEKDKIKIGESFRPGDIVRAEVISLGDQSNYYLSTARNELGVVLAKSEVGNVMSPVSWKEVKDPVTGASEARKVAKPT